MLGPLVNIALAFLIVWASTVRRATTNQVSKQVAAVEQSTPAARCSSRGQLVSVNGIKGSADQIRKQIDSTHCAGPLDQRMRRRRSRVKIVVRRDGSLVTVSARPRYNAADKRMLLGFEFAGVVHYPSASGRHRPPARGLWTVDCDDTVSAIARVFEPQERKQLHGVVGGL